ncbi:hypothetical protein ACFC3F_08070 [Microbacterium sp. NPDC055910]|uniref:hypothetical protein n=1 Tax=Microbacterium sp. NPDC055910 TaxID=3345659 RepID=UPI0035D9841D
MNHDREPSASDEALDNASEHEDDQAEPKADGLGKDSTIPSDPDGVAAGYTGVKSTFEPEEDEQA